LQQLRDPQDVRADAADHRPRYRGQHGSLHVGAAAAAPPVQPMSRTFTRQLDFLMLGIGLLVIWQGLFLWIGETGISSPWQTVRHLAALSERQMFWTHAWATLDAFLRSLVIAAAGGIVIGLWLGIGR